MNLFKNVDKSWIPLLHSLAHKEPLVDFLQNLNQISYQPAFEEIFKVFEMPVKDIKLVILGQEPNPRPGAAIGTAFAVSEQSKPTAVLSSIRKELLDTNQFHVVGRYWKTLTHWTEQGVFLLNTSLTVETGVAGSHRRYWKDFTEMVISFISHENPCVWMLWGRESLSYSSRITNPLIVKGYDRDSIEDIPVDPKINYIIPGHHPVVMLMKGTKEFSGDGFYFTNKILTKKSLKQITW